jgi:mycoredoxin
VSALFSKKRQLANPISPAVVVYGTKWYGATQAARRFLERNGIPYQFRDMDADPEAQKRVRWWTGGYTSRPTVQIGGDILIEPAMNELNSALERNGLL